MSSAPGVPADRRVEVSRHLHKLIDQAAQIRLPELFAVDNPEALYRVHDRNGVTTIVLRTDQLHAGQLRALLQYRLAQYLARGYVDAEMVYEARLEHEPASSIGPDDIHVIAGSARSGDILCYLTLLGLREAPSGATLGTRNRPLFPVEERAGWGLFNRLGVLPDISVHAVREMGRFVKNQQHGSMEELAIRGPVEVGAAVFRALIGPLSDVQALIGDIKEDVAKPNLDFFHAPTVVVHGAVHYFSPGSYLQRSYEVGTAYPFALLVADLAGALPRLEAVEKALALPGRHAILALLTLRKDRGLARSSLEPAQGLPVLTDAVVAEQSASMSTRRRILDFGEELRSTDLFHELSVSEAAVLGTFMDRIETPEGAVILRRGDPGDALLLIETGQAEVQVADASGRPIVVGLRGPGEYVGEIALINESVRTADVIARTPMTLLRLGREPYIRYLRHLVEVEQHLARTAASRAASTRQQLAGL